MNVHQLGQSDNGARVDTKVGDTVRIMLDETRTAGFRWTLGDYDTSICRVASDVFKPPAGATSGGTGHHVWTFEVLDAGETKLAFSYGRNWSRDGAEPSFTATVLARK